MKVRQGFVSNSLSSSFMIRRHDISDKQLEMIKDHIQVAHKYDLYTDNSDRWQVTVDDYIVELSTTMDNFDMENFLIDIVKVFPETIQGGKH